MIDSSYRAIRLSVSDKGNGAYRIDGIELLSNCGACRSAPVASCPAFISDLVECAVGRPRNWVCSCITARPNHGEVTVTVRIS